MNDYWRRFTFRAIVIAGALLLFITFGATPTIATEMQSVLFVLVGGLLLLQVSLFLKSLYSDRKAKLRVEVAQSQSAQSLVGLMLNRKVRQSSVVYFFLFLSLFVSWYLPALEIISVRIEAVFFISALIVANFVGQKILEYRIKKGLFGANEYEAREIVSFILSNKNWLEFTNGRGGRGIFPESEEELIHSNEALSDTKEVG